MQAGSHSTTVEAGNSYPSTKCLMSKNVCRLSDGRGQKCPHPQNIILPVRSKHITVFPNPLRSWSLTSMLNNG